jgi:predicted enzyme related to lactoylglutathione lyase
MPQDPQQSLTPPDAGTVELAITFFYYRDLPAAIRFYEAVMGLRLAIDQGWSKIYRISGQAHLGLVDEARGMHRSAPEKPVQLCIRVPDVDAWHRYATAQGVAGLSKLFVNEALGIRAFVFEDPEGYQIEVQTATRAGA